jgi:hypothetical protein
MISATAPKIRPSWMRAPSVALLSVSPLRLNATASAGPAATPARANAPRPRRRRRPSAVTMPRATASATKPPREYVSPMVSSST